MAVHSAECERVFFLFSCGRRARGPAALRRIMIGARSVAAQVCSPTPRDVNVNALLCTSKHEQRDSLCLLSRLEVVGREYGVDRMLHTAAADEMQLHCGDPRTHKFPALESCHRRHVCRSHLTARLILTAAQPAHWLRAPVLSRWMSMHSAVAV